MCFFASHIDVFFVLNSVDIFGQILYIKYFSEDHVSLRRKMSVFGVFLYRIFPHSDQKNFEYGHFSRSNFYSHLKEFS